MIFHVHEVEKFNCRTLEYFMSTIWKSLTGELYGISCPQSGKVKLENSAIFHVNEVEKFKWKTLTGKLYEISCLLSGNV